MTIPHQGLAEEDTVYVGNKRTEKKLNNKLCKPDWLLFSGQFARKNSSSGFFITDYAYRDGSMFAI